MAAKLFLPLTFPLGMAGVQIPFKRACGHHRDREECD